MGKNTGSGAIFSRASSWPEIEPCFLYWVRFLLLSQQRSSFKILIKFFGDVFSWFGYQWWWLQNVLRVFPFLRAEKNQHKSSPACLGEFYLRRQTANFKLLALQVVFSNLIDSIYFVWLVRSINTSLLDSTLYKVYVLESHPFQWWLSIWQRSLVGATVHGSLKSHHHDDVRKHCSAWKGSVMFIVFFWGFYFQIFSLFHFLFVFKFLLR